MYFGQNKGYKIPFLISCSLSGKSMQYFDYLWSLNKSYRYVFVLTRIFPYVSTYLFIAVFDSKIESIILRLWTAFRFVMIFLGNRHRVLWFFLHTTHKIASHLISPAVHGDLFQRDYEMGILQILERLKIWKQSNSHQLVSRNRQSDKKQHACTK